MIRIKLVENDNRIDNPIIGATLLSKEEYEKYKNNILKPENYLRFDGWWLRSAGDSSSSACGESFGDVYRGYGVTYHGNGIRPALILNLQSFNLNVGDKFEFGKYTFTTLSKELAICNDFICKGCFREDWQAEDANVYEKSDVKKIVDDWFNNSIQKEPNFFNKNNIDFMLQNNDNPELKAQLLQINHDLGQDKREEDDLSWLDMSDEEFKKYMDEHPDEF